MSAVEVIEPPILHEPSHYVAIEAANHFNKADRLSDWRGKVVCLLGPAIACLPDNPITCGITLHGIDTDRRDGQRARMGAALLGPNATTTKEGAAKDHENDKEFVNNLLPAIAAKDIVSGRKITAAIVTSAALINVKRDEKMASTRAMASKYGLDTKAIFINKFKTGSIMAGIGLDTVPLYGRFKKYERIKPIVRTALIAGGVAIGVIGQRVYEKQVQEQLPEHSKTKLNRYFNPY
jgi:hypothetical protein